MVVVLDIEVLRALVGDYKAVVIRKNSIKCYGFHDKVYDAKDILDIGLPKREDIKKDIVSDFLRSDIIAWQPHHNNSDVDIIIRNDGKVLEIEKTLLSSYNNEIKAYLVIAVKRSLFNLIKIGNGLLEINLRKDKIIVTDKYTKKIAFESNHLLDLEIPNLVSYLLEFVSKHNDIRINYQFNKPVSTDITVFNTHVSFTGDEKNVFPIIISCADCKENLKNVNYHQLKLEDFKYEK